ncbi:MAG: nuclear transport factor 2 family protein [Vicinamibacterales bacterium]
MRMRFVLVPLVMVLAGLAAVQAQDTPAITALDYYQIQQLNARYSHGLDSGDGELFASVFTPDGVLIDEAGRTTTGRSALTALPSATAAKGPTNLSHFDVNLVVDAVPGGAIAKSMVAIVAPSPGQPERVTKGGQYWDDLVRTPQGWRIKRRTFLVTGTPHPDTQPLATKMPTFAAASPRETALGLTVADYADIYELYGRYAWAYDKTPDEGRMFGDLFTDDGMLVDAEGKATVGRDNLMEMVMRKGALKVTTLLANIMLDVTPSGVSAKAYLMRRNIPQAPQVNYDEPGGMFFDRLVKTPAGWRFRARLLVAPHGPAPDAIPTGTVGVTHARQAPGSERLSPDDRAQIQHLYARYAHGIESAADNGQLYASVFTPDAEFRTAGDYERGGVVGIPALIKQYAFTPDGKPKPIRLGHETWNVFADAAPWGAVARAYFNAGYYIDTLVKTPNGWRFKYKNWRRDYAAPAPAPAPATPPPPAQTLR